ncbi:MAG: hydrogenase maturation nickel metallochaperone HypA [Deltaproteobacteria bacterium]|nr:MAG: hydrogenase maturation nickel metallochaperone HypA [Deltaproteobacteria bacterium]
MHELSIAQGILDIIQNEAEKNAIERVSAVRLKLGKLTAVEPSSLSFCFELITKGTLAEGARLEIETVPITGRCAQCGREFTLEDPFCNCPVCQGLKIDILTGREFYISEIETDD